MEKEGIIHAIQNEKNGYKYYDREQVISLQRIRSYRSLGFSLDEAKQMLSNTNRESLLPQIDQKLNELAKKEAQLREMQLLLKRQREATQLVVEGCEFEITKNLPIIFFPRTIKEWAAPTTVGPWLRAMPSVMMFIYVDANGIQKRGLATYEQNINQHNLMVYPAMIRLESRPCIHGALESPTYEKPNIQSIFDWAKKQHISLTGELFCVLQATYYRQPQEKWTIHEIYAPICK